MTAALLRQVTSRKGQAIVEFALTIGLLVAALLAIFELYRCLYLRLALRYASFAAARSGAVHSEATLVIRAANAAANAVAPSIAPVDAKVRRRGSLVESRAGVRLRAGSLVDATTVPGW